MEYSELLDAAFEITRDEEVADAAVKAIFGILASHVPEARARELAACLPAPLTFEKLRGHQRRAVTPIGLARCAALLSAQLPIGVEEARELLGRVLRAAVDTLPVEKLLPHLPEDWAPALRRAA